LGRSAAQLKELRGPGVAAFPSDLTRYQQVELVAAAHLSSAAEALRQLDSDHRAALLAQLDVTPIGPGYAPAELSPIHRHSLR